MTATTSSSSCPPLTGVLVALITPWIDDGSSISAPRLQSHIEHLIASGVHGLVSGGTTSEFTASTLPERKQLLERCVEYAAGRVFVVAGTGALSTQDTVELASHAAAAGAATLMIVPPFYDPISYAQLRELLAEVHDAAGGLPLMYYNIPAASGLTLTPEQLAGLADVGVKYLKDTSGDAPAFTELMFSLDDRITAFNGWDTLTFYGLAAGSKGCVWGASNVVPELSVELWEAVAVKGDLKRGSDLWRRIWPIRKFLEQHNYPSAVKTGMELRGMETGGMRKPFKLLDGDLREEFRGLLQAAGVKTAGQTLLHS